MYRTSTEEKFYSDILTISKELQELQEWMNASSQNSQKQEDHHTFWKIIDFYFTKAPEGFISFRHLTKYQAAIIFEKILKHLSDKLIPQNGQELDQTLEYKIDITDGPELYPRFRNVDKEWNLPLIRNQDQPSIIIIKVTRSFARKFKVYYELEKYLSRYTLKRVFLGDLKSILFNKVPDDLSKGEILSKLVKPLLDLSTEEFLNFIEKSKSSLPDDLKQGMIDNRKNKPKSLNALITMIKNEEEKENYVVYTFSNFENEIYLEGTNSTVLFFNKDNFQAQLDGFLEDQQQKFLIIRLKEEFKFHHVLNDLRNFLDHSETENRRRQSGKSFIIILYVVKVQKKFEETRANFISFDKNWNGITLENV